MNVLTLDVETTHKTKESGGTTALPYFGNRLVSIGYKWLGEEEVGYDFTLIKEPVQTMDGSRKYKMNLVVLM